ncbi:MAG: tRNA dimethylallyltransferase [Candidatus Roizmanbacteria bacterium GW2011_GWA2_35_8]|uniref:tRNA dimethylallyltransferase n=1 Tax=Candidatus Roizmanbacteria bacterium GW2011_GWA2_35_8 TaxID=1618479 RepID=A0A0G0CZ19_9BACT|nr:MAG: tRNA dimethylallyltransferase [Candidatus Roizmanbacteria bacterium GW2011_GWA2_35_8]
MDLIIITGQTATGKTNLAFEYAAKYNGEIVNFDSRQIYKYLDIITGKDLPIKSKIKNQRSKPSFKIKNRINNFDIGYYKLPTTDNLSSEVLPKIRHPRTSEVKLWLYDVVFPDQYFSSYDFTQCANLVVEDIVKRGKTPILVGGTYFYLKHFLYGFNVSPVPANPGLREKLNNKSVVKLQDTLKRIDLKSFESMNNSDKNNPRRLIRKIEIATSNQQPVTTIHEPRTYFFQSAISNQQLAIKQFIGLKYKRKENLVAAIKQRVEKRLKQGALDEVRSLLKKGYKASDPGLTTIGYQELIQYLEGKLTEDKAIETWVNHEVQYAKRQLTFMKKDENIHWNII